MSSGLTIPDDLLQRALSWALQQALESVDKEALAMLDANQAAKLLHITPRAFRELECDHIDFGPHRTRWTLKDLKALIESRRVKARS